LSHTCGVPSFVVHCHRAAPDVLMSRPFRTLKKICQDSKDVFEYKNQKLACGYKWIQFNNPLSL